MSQRCNQFYFYILLLETNGKKRVPYFKHESVQLLPGELLYRQPDNLSNVILELMTFTLFGDRSVTVSCLASSVEPISDIEFNLLASINVCEDRLKVYQDKNRLKLGVKLSVGHHILVKIKKSSRDHKVPGIIKFKGNITNKKGIMFGVELEEMQGNCDGQPHFSCRPNFGIYANLSQVDIHPNFKVSTHEIPNLKVSDRVVWISDKIPQFGQVKWTGTLYGRIFAGVEFDNKIGNGTGKLYDQRLFNAKQDHASIVPVAGLMREDLYIKGKNEGESVSYNNHMYYGSKPDIGHKDIGHHGYPTLSRNAAISPSSFNAENGLPEVYPIPMQPTHPEVIKSGLEVSSLVQVFENPPRYGVIRWIGILSNNRDEIIAGIEMDEETQAGTDGIFCGIRIFDCPKGHALFVPLWRCKRDRRVLSGEYGRTGNFGFGSSDSPDIPGTVAPPDIKDTFKNIVGRNKGIQGHHNSCYMDATLVSMFYFSVVFDSIFYRQRRESDINEFEIVQKTLQHGIVNPLRKNYYVRADKVMKFRQLMDKLGSVTGMLTEEKDPEEFLNVLFHIMKFDPLIKLSTGQESFIYQVFLEKENHLSDSPTVQQLLSSTFHQSNIKLAEVPPCLILQMPRHGKDYKLFKRIVPSLVLDITDILDGAPRECSICGDLATIECRECYGSQRVFDTETSLFEVAICKDCSALYHSHPDRQNHNPQMMNISEEFVTMYHNHKSHGRAMSIPKFELKLFAVLCIETSHYVTFLNTGPMPTHPWLFLDSMADRIGGQGGYNVPNVSHVHDFTKWLTSENLKSIKDKKDKNLPEHLRRLLCDAYIFFYYSPDVSMFN